MISKYKRLLIIGGVCGVAVVAAVIIIINILNGDGGSGIIQDGEVENNLGDFKPEYGTFKFSGSYSDTKDTEAQYAYSDKYFTIDSTVYNASLATMSMCLELSSWSSNETDVWNEKSRNAKELLGKIGFTNIAQNDYWNDKPSKDSIGAVVASKTIEDATVIALAIRGGGYYSEWGSNVTVGESKEHQGFVTARDHIVSFLNSYIEGNNIKGKVKLWIVGFSRGGAVANMTAGYLNKEGLKGDVTLAFNDLYCYTFEAPQGTITSIAGNDSEHANIHNVVNANDLVTLVAPNSWEFARYNSTSRLLPTITTKGFTQALDTMLVEYNKIIDSSPIENKEETKYNISEYAKKLQVSVDILSFMPSGDPFISFDIVDDTTLSQAEMLNNSISALIDAVKSRENYNKNAEADIALLLEQMLKYGTDNSMGELIGNLATTLTKNNYENLIYVVTPLFQISTDSIEEREKEVLNRLNEVVPQPEGFEDLYGSLAVILEAICSMMVNDTESLFDIILSFSSTSMLQVHSGEIILAWLRAGDPHYTDTPYTKSVPETVRIVNINCPVDIKVYDNTKNLVAETVNKIGKTYNEVVGCGVNNNGEIVVHLPSDEAYEIVVTATDDGEVDITISEFNMVHNEVTRVQNHEDIPVIKDDVINIDVPNIIDEEYIDEEQNGSTTKYIIKNNKDEELQPSSEASGDNVKYFKVEVEGNGKYGLAVGGGEYLEGTYEQVEAYPVANGEFVGWYINETLVSGELIYRFAVLEDMKIVAKFKEIDLTDTKFSIVGEGTVSNIDKEYSTGSKVYLSATPKDGFVFDHWETSSGKIDNIYERETFIIIEGDNAIVTAIFRERTEEDIVLCDNCNEELGMNETHKAECGVEGHYSCQTDISHTLGECGTNGHYMCDGKDHSIAKCGNEKHYTCDGANHNVADCGVKGHYECDDSEHTKAACGVIGHYVCDGKTHGKATCGVTGHYICDDMTHTVGACGVEGHYACDGKTHTVGACGVTGHYMCDGKTHGKAACNVTGHYTCDGTSHEVAACGVAGHYICDGKTHGKAACGVTGHYTCDDLTHVAGACGVTGHYTCDGLTHTAGDCGVTGHYTCDGAAHVAGACGKTGHYACDGVTHTAAACKTAGHYTCDGASHGVAACGVDGHYTCDGKTHSLYNCVVEVTLAAPTTAELIAALQSYRIVHVTNGDNIIVTEADSVTIAEEQIVNLNGGTATINESAVISLDGTLNVGASATLSNGGEFEGTGTINNNGRFNNTNVSFDPTAVTIINNGKYIDDLARDNMMAMVTDSDNKITHWNMLDFIIGEAGEVGWIDGSTYTLYGEQPLDYSTYVRSISGDEAKNVTIDLNGRVLSLNSEIAIESYASSLTIEDNSDAGNGELLNEYGPAIAIYGSGSKCIVNSGTVNSNADYLGTIVYNADNCSIVINGGKVINGVGNAIGCDTGYGNNSTIEVNGGRVEGAIYGIYNAYEMNITPSSSLTIIIDGVSYTEETISQNDVTLGTTGVVTGGRIAIYIEAMAS